MVSARDCALVLRGPGPDSDASTRHLADYWEHACFLKGGSVFAQGLTLPSPTFEPEPCSKSLPAFRLMDGILLLMKWMKKLMGSMCTVQTEQQRKLGRKAAVQVKPSRDPPLAKIVP